MSAASAGFVSSTATNPIWFVKTRMQLDYNSKVQMTVRQCIERVYAQGGLAAFYKGITASYFGICETMVHFVIYEFIKSKLVSWASESTISLYLSLTIYFAVGTAQSTAYGHKGFPRLPGIHDGWRRIQDNCLLYCVSTRGGTNASAWGGKQV